MAFQYRLDMLYIIKKIRSTLKHVIHNLLIYFMTCAFNACLKFPHTFYGVARCDKVVKHKSSFFVELKIEVMHVGASVGLQKWSFPLTWTSDHTLNYLCGCHTTLILYLMFISKGASLGNRRWPLSLDNDLLRYREALTFLNYPPLD